jgi:uncharacterized membrane protein
MIWLGLVAKNFYQNNIGHLMTTNVNYIAALIFYLLFIVGLVVFVIQPSLETKRLQDVLLRGALFGLITYATYDLTNLATLKDWPLLVTVVDLIWGMVLSTSVATATYLIASSQGQ